MKTNSDPRMGFCRLCIRKSTLALLILTSAFFSPELNAQISGSIEVKVSDATQASVPGAAVKARSLSTGTLRSAVTNELGVALISQLAIGDYEVKVEAAGFAVYSSQASVNSGATVTIPIVLEVKGAEQTVVVSDAAALLNTMNAQLQNSVEAKKIVDLPLNGNTLNLAGMSPGIAPVTPRNPFLGLGSFNSNGGEAVATTSLWTMQLRQTFLRQAQPDWERYRLTASGSSRSSRTTSTLSMGVTPALRFKF